MSANEWKLPTSMKEMEELRRTMRREISPEELKAVSGGNDNLKDKNKGINWTCPGCGANIIVKQLQDACKHMTKCPGNPFK